MNKLKESSIIKLFTSDKTRPMICRIWLIIFLIWAFADAMTSQVMSGSTGEVITLTWAVLSIPCSVFLLFKAVCDLAMDFSWKRLILMVLILTLLTPLDSIFALLLCSAGGNDLKKDLIPLYFVELAAFILVVALAVSGIFINMQIVKDGHSALTWCMGYDHPNLFAEKCFAIAVFTLVFSNRKIIFLTIALLIALIPTARIIADSNTTVIAAALMIVLSILLLIYESVKDSKFKNFLAFCFDKLKYLSIIIPVISIVMLFVPKELYTPYLQITFASRFYRGQEYYLEHGIHLFSTGDYGVVDNSWMFLLLRVGLLSFIFFTTLYGIFIFKLAKEKRYRALCAAAIFITFGLLENMFLILRYDFMLILLGEFFYFSEESPKNQQDHFK